MARAELRTRWRGLVGLGLLLGLVGGVVLGAVALVIAAAAQLRLAALRRRFTVLWAGGETDVATVAARQETRLAELSDELTAVRGDVAAVRTDLAESLRHVAVVRYDAFGDMGGRLSFSAAVIDDHGDGLVFSSIHARGESRTYAKGVVGGTSDATLTPEEQQALAAARTGKETP